MDLDQLTRHIADQPTKARRKLVALAGPPASGKSTLAESLCNRLSGSCVVPMDGFHLNNDILRASGLLAGKGSPATFDAEGFVHLMTRLTTEDEVCFPLFDRASDRVTPNAGTVDIATNTVIVEGNYLLLDQPIWRDLSEFWDVSIQLSVPLPVLRARLVQRWIDHGFSPEDAVRKTEGNDLPNAARVLANALPAQIVLTEDVS